VQVGDLVRHVPSGEIKILYDALGDKEYDFKMGVVINIKYNEKRDYTMIEVISENGKLFWYSSNELEIMS